MRADPLVDRLVALALEEDLGLGDPTTAATVPRGQEGLGRIVAKEACVVAGTDVAERVFRAVDPAVAVQWHLADGDGCDPGTVIGEARGPMAGLLRAERTVLNFLQRLSGIATLARAFAEATAGTGAVVVDTRKTTPGWRILEKRAVRAGGCANHRMSLGSGILVKDNHIEAAGGVAAAVRAARSQAPVGMQVEVEVRTAGELEEAIAAGADGVLLDNMPLDGLRRCAERARAAGLWTEASGGVTLERVAAVAACGVDRISAGALTHSARAVDIHMKVRRTES